MIKPIFQHVLVAVNGSESSIQAAMYAIIMAKVYHSKVKVLYVVDTAAIRQLTLSNFLVSDESQSVENNLVSDGEKTIAYIESLAKSKGIKIESEIKKGAVASEILKTSEEYKANVILLGGKLHSNTASYVHDDIGIETRKILSNAHCPVMIVKQYYIEQMFKLT